MKKHLRKIMLGLLVVCLFAGSVGRADWIAGWGDAYAEPHTNGTNYGVAQGLDETDFNMGSDDISSGYNWLSLENSMLGLSGYYWGIIDNTLFSDKGSF